MPQTAQPWYRHLAGMYRPMDFAPRAKAPAPFHAAPMRRLESGAVQGGPDYLPDDGGVPADDSYQANLADQDLAAMDAERPQGIIPPAAPDTPLPDAAPDYSPLPDFLGPPVPSKPSPQGISPAYSSDLDAYKAMIAKQPVETQPKWWQRALGAAAGFGAGYSNAASRTKHPIDVDEMEQNILHPGYQSKLAEWQSRVAPLKEAADIEAQRQGAAMKAEQMGSTTALQGAQADRARALAQMADRRYQGQWKTDPRNGDLVNNVTAERIPAPDTPQSRLEYGQQLVKLGVMDPASLQYYVVNKTLPPPKAMEPTPPKQPNEWSVYLDAAGGDPNKARQLYANDQARFRAVAPDIAADARNNRGVTPAQSSGIEARKNTRLQQAEAAARKAIATGTEQKDAMAALEQTKQQIQNDYEGEIAAATGNAPGHFEYGAQPAAPVAAGGGRGAPTASAPAPVIRKYNPATGKLE